MSYLDESPDGLKLITVERRPFLIPVSLAVLVILAVLLGWNRLFPDGRVTLVPVRVDLVPTHTVFKTDSILVGAEQAQDELYVAATIRLHDPLRVPITVDDVTCTLTDAHGAEMTVSAVEATDLGSIQMSFPQLKPAMVKPLPRESTVAAGQEVDGTVLFHFPLTKAIWSTRQSAVLTVSLYHRDPLTVTLPKELDK